MKRFAVLLMSLALCIFSITVGCGTSASKSDAEQTEPVVQDLNISSDEDVAAEEQIGDDKSGPDINGPDTDN